MAKAKAKAEDTTTLTPQQIARAAGYVSYGVDPNAFLSRDSQRVMSAEQVAAELDAERDRESDTA